MKKSFLFVFLLLSMPVFATEPGGMSLSERYSYAMGVRIGQAMAERATAELDSQAFAAAIDDVLQGRALRLSDVQMAAAIAEQQQLLAAQRARRAAERLEAGRAFLAANAAAPGVVTLPSGLQYQVLATGQGAVPTVQDRVRVHYHGMLLDGAVFDSSVDRGEPAEFSLAGVIPGFREAILQMRVGDSVRVFLPPELAYGEAGAGTDIGPNETLVFDLQLLDIVR